MSKEKIAASEYFAILPESILFAPISSNAIRLYCILRRRADEKTNACYPSQNYLAKHMYCSVRTVQRALDELINIGAVTVEHRYLEDTEAYTSNMYYLHATIAQGSAHVRKGMADMSQGYGADVVLNIPNKQSKETNTSKTRKRDLLFEEMCNGLGIDWKNAPKGETGRVNAALKDLRPLNVTPEQLREVMEHYKKNWKVAISATAISNNWTKLLNEIKEAAPSKPRDCNVEGHNWIDLDQIYICQFCREERSK